MKSVLQLRLLFALIFMLGISDSFAQVEERPRPAAWNDLVEGGRFMDLFQPIPPVGKRSSEVWGAAGVIPRYPDNGLEDADWSYWGGNIIQGEDGKYHMYVCRWSETAEKGHMEWPKSRLVHAVSDQLIGPFTVMDEVGAGHNPEIFQIHDGRYIIYVIGGRYLSESLDGPWEYAQFEFDARDRPIIEGLSNLSFAQREDGSIIMVCRGGGIWISKDGLSTYQQVSDKSVYPPVEGRYEDPVIWKDEHQYHLIVNDWLGRIAYYLRSPDGFDWTVDAGEAYQPGITGYTDGLQEDWFKYERIKIFQDESGRAIQANFAVIDTLKHEDKSNDGHSSKNIGIPLAVGRKIRILNKKVSESTQELAVVIEAEEGFDPHSDLDLSSVRFGNPQAVNFGGGSELISTKQRGEDLVLIFDSAGLDFSEDSFVAKLLGKTHEGALVFGYSPLPWRRSTSAYLSSRKPQLEEGVWSVKLENFGLASSDKSLITIERLVEETDSWEEVGRMLCPVLKPYEEILLTVKAQEAAALSSDDVLKVIIDDQETVFGPIVHE